MLTPQMIQQMNAVTGNKVPLNPNAPPSRAEQVRAIAKSSAAATQPKQEGGIGGKVSDFVESTGKVLGGNEIGKALGTAAFDMGQMAQGKNPFENPTKIAGVKQPGINPASEVNVPRLIGDVVKSGSTVAGLGAAPAGLLKTVGDGAAVGAAQLGGGELSETGDIKQATKEAGKGALLGGITSGAMYGIGKLVGKIGDKIMTSVIKPSKTDVADGFDLKTIKEHDLGGSLNQTLEKTQKKLGDLSSELSTKLASSGAKVDLNDVVTQTAKELMDSSKLKGFGANAKILNTLEQLKNEATIVAENGGVSIPDAQIIKQAAGNFGAWQYGKVDPESKASEIVYNTFYNKLKNAIEKGSPEGVREINKQLSKLIPIQNAVLRRLPVADRAGLVSLNDMIGLVGSTINPVALGPTLLNLVSKSGVAGNILSKTGPAISKTALPLTTAETVIGSQVKPE